MEEKKRLNGAGFCAVLGLVVLLSGLGAWLLLGQEPEPAEPLPVEVTDPVRQPEAVERPAPKPAAPTAVTPPSPPPMPETAPVAAEQPIAAEKPELPREEALVVAPVKGEVLSAFSAEELQFNPTLEDWRTHDGVDLAARPGATVLAASAGTVLSVADDPLMGTTVRLSHPGGWETVYANLQTQPPVLEGDEVSAGQIIGAVGRTAAAELSQPPHLHFSVWKDGEVTDPERFLSR